MAHEYALHRHISELMKQLGLPDTSDQVVYVNALENKNNNSSAQISIYDARKKIAESCKKVQEFGDKYKILKQQNIKELDNFVYLLSRILSNHQVLAMLEKTVKKVEPKMLEQSAAIGQIKTNLTLEEVGRIKAELSKATSSRTTGMSIILKKVKHKDIIKEANFPAFPDWVHKRSFLSSDFVLDQIPAPFMEDVKNIPTAAQEKILVEDLLYCCEGIEGRFIRCEPVLRPSEARKFKIDLRLDTSLIRLVERILPMCSMYSGVVRFVERKYDFKNGLVNQALVAAISDIMKEYNLLIARLEHQQRLGSLTLQKFWFYIQTTMHTMEVLSSIISSIHDTCRGGSVLTVLHEKTISNTGDSKAQKLCHHLTRAACVPYFEILEDWIYKGIISDPYYEFMVRQNDEIHKEKLGQDFNDTYWENKYTLRVENTPIFLERVATKILKTGKYLNVIRECGRDVCYPAAELLEYNFNENQITDRVENAIQYASSLLLDVLVREMDLMTRLRSIKHYFLLDQGDFIVQFMDMSKHEMKKKMKDIHLPRLETLLELALRTSTANADPYKDDLKVDLLPIDLVSQLFKILSIETKQEKHYVSKFADHELSGLESFTFDYVVRWPISLVLNRKALAKYQILSRHLFYCKYVEQQLCHTWMRDKSLKMLMPAPRAHALRQRMLNFVQNFEYFFMLEVIEPHWQLFESNMSKVTNVDEVLSHHEEFLNNCLRDSMLTDDSLLRSLHKIMMTCVLFHNNMQKINMTFKSGPSTSSLEVIMEHASEVQHNKSYEETIEYFESAFTAEYVTLQNKIVDLSEQSSDHKLGNILLRLDFNGFYKKERERSLEIIRTSSFKTVRPTTTEK